MFEDKKNNKDKPSDKLYEIQVRTLEATVSLVQYLYTLLLQHREKGINCVVIAYLLDSACAYLLSYYGGRNDIVEEIRATCEKEIVGYLNGPTTKEQAGQDIKKIEEDLKGLGVNFKFKGFEQKTSKVKKEDWKPSQADIEAWMTKNMDYVLDEYIKRKKKEENGK